MQEGGELFGKHGCSSVSNSHFTVDHFALDVFMQLDFLNSLDANVAEVNFVGDEVYWVLCFSQGMLEIDYLHVCH